MRLAVGVIFLRGTRLTFTPGTLTAATFAALMGLIAGGSGRVVVCDRTVCGLSLAMRWRLRVFIQWRVVRRTCRRAFTTATTTASAVTALTRLTRRTLTGVAVSVVV